MPAFEEHDVRAFETSSAHMTRALQMGTRLLWPGGGLTQGALVA